MPNIRRASRKRTPPTSAIFSSGQPSRSQNDRDYRARWAGRFDWVHADEYQDVNFAQCMWLKSLASHGRRMFVVGDAVSAASLAPELSDRARRRLFERLVALAPRASSPGAKPSASTGSERHGAEAERRARLRSRAVRPAAGA